MRPNFLAKIIILTVLILLLALFVSDCKNSPPTKASDKPVVWNTPRENKEAEEAALWLSDSLVAPETLYTDILNHLAAIRAEYSDSIPQVNITFVPPWVTGGIIIGITDEAAQRIRNGQYNDLDSLNSVFGLSGMDTTLLRLGNFVVLSFKGRFHPKHLAEVYEHVPSVVYAEPNRIGGDFSNVYPWFFNSGLTYLFREGEGDCPSGCIYSCYWYFRVTPSGIGYVGTWCTSSGSGDPGPDWWWEARQGMIYFRGIREL